MAGFLDLIPPDRKVEYFHTRDLTNIWGDLPVGAIAHLESRPGQAAINGSQTNRIVAIRATEQTACPELGSKIAIPAIGRKIV
jgi:hypothetical protein